MQQMFQDKTYLTFFIIIVLIGVIYALTIYVKSVVRSELHKIKKQHEKKRQKAIEKEIERERELAEMNKKERDHMDADLESYADPMNKQAQIPTHMGNTADQQEPFGVNSNGNMGTSIDF